ncbi:hypothetical protein BGZ61DRAFT_495505 [Ilyonectria robusta]|uniref:uncharacterized protein n=1 Tax=Ilyonectria robusta TaxID=1079257 RepID=UPI001E8CCEC9|nr:uncharacterized protein BGZ61DRAFT_495505 [Ilyonectria robusta]KAH8685280.1 hypothetical protein BGZ61DRAFT_495505 [Ilyonectria robusta]
MATTTTNNVGDKSSGLFSYAQSSLDRVVSPSSRQRAYDSTAEFASARPILFSFIVAQLLFSFLPVLLFATFSLSTVAFSLGAALVFALFWIGVAFMVLMPALLLTSSVAVLIWGWAVGSFLVARWLYNHAPIGNYEDKSVGVAKK